MTSFAQSHLPLNSQLKSNQNQDRFSLLAFGSLGHILCAYLYFRTASGNQAASHCCTAIINTNNYCFVIFAIKSSSINLDDSPRLRTVSVCLRKEILLSFPYLLRNKSIVIWIEFVALTNAFAYGNRRLEEYFLCGMFISSFNIRYRKEMLKSWSTNLEESIELFNSTKYCASF